VFTLIQVLYDCDSAVKRNDKFYTCTSDCERSTHIGIKYDVKPYTLTYLGETATIHTLKLMSVGM